MTNTQPSGGSTPLSQEENAQLLHFLQECSNNLRYAKTQQWLAGHLTILAYAALVAAAYAVADGRVRPLTGTWPGILVAIWSVVVLAAGVTGVWMVWDLQRWMARIRRSLSEAEEHLSCRYRRIAGSVHGDKHDYHSVFYRASQTWLIIGVIALGALIALTTVIARFFA